jgi:hypothetical protein
MKSPIQDLDLHAARTLLHQISDAFGIGMEARTPSVILTNVANAHRRSECLSEVENHHMTLQPDDDGEMVEECPLRWSDTRSQYRTRYEDMMERLVPPAGKCVCGFCDGTDCASR